ncbi:MAG: hypothetical protein ABI054_07305 [Planctomycetota bacterium]
MNEIIRRAAWLTLLLAFALGLSPTLAQQKGTPTERLEALIERVHTTNNDYFEKNWKKDLTEEQREEVLKNRPGLEFLAEFEALAVEAKGTDVSAKARTQELSIQCDFQKKEDAQKTLDLLLTETIQSKALADLPSTLMYSYGPMAGEDRAQAALQTMLDKSEHKEVKASALYSLATMSCGRKSTATQKAQGRKYFERLIGEFGDLAPHGKTYKESAEAFLFELDHLQIGMVAPDFESIDENGTKFKLSDYRGKVLVIDFWGNW